MALRFFLGFFGLQFSSLLFVSISSQVSVTVAAPSSSLYSPDDPLWDLDASNFGVHVFGKSNVWIIEFYNSWCGHCIRFAPTWKRFAKDIQTWKNVIDVAVINCAESENLKLCRDYEVESYPTIKLFWANINETEKGQLLMGDRDVLSMRHSVIDYLEDNAGKGVPESWPRLGPVESENLIDLWNDIPKRISSVLIIVEPPDSYKGREVILDFAFRKHPVIRRVSTTNTALLSHLKYAKNTTGIVVLKLERDGNEELVHSFPSNANGTFVRDQIFAKQEGYPRTLYSANLPEEAIASPEESSVQGVHMTDLENALWYTLRQEIPVHQNISETKLAALQKFLLALKMYFPGSLIVMKYLNKVSNWANNQKTNLTGEEFLQALDQLETEKEFIPKMQEWVGCKGSESRYRGYPCSLWTLFHTLSVQAYAIYESDPLYTKEDPHKVVFTIRDYVKYFFTCGECSRHFQEMAVNMQQEVRNPQDTVLWLWNAHNKVNRRLAGDATEDPLHPKVQFPPEDLCSKCRREGESPSNNIKWDTNAVLRFLLHFYGRQNIIRYTGNFRVNSEDNKSGSNFVHFPNSHTDRIQDNERVISSPDTSNFGKWNFRWFTSTDVSLCVSLYFVSALLLVIIYLLFTQRRKRRKSQFMKYLHLYP